MKILAFFASPHFKGFSSTIHHFFLKKFLDEKIKVEKVYLYKKRINPCLACNYCQKNFTCFQKDEMANLYQKIEKANLISISAPLYFSSLPGVLKNFIDRCQAFWEKNNHPQKTFKKLGFFISTAGGEYQEMFLASKIIIRHFFKTLDCSFREEDYLFISKTDKIKEINKKDLVLAQKKGEKIYNYLKKL